MIYRKANPEEIEDIWRIVMDGKASLAALGIDQWQGTDPTHEMIEADMAAGQTRVVADEDGTILGTLVFWEGGEPDYDNVTAGGWFVQSGNGTGDELCRYAALHRVAVGAHATRRGVASFMFEQALAEAREKGYASVRIDTHHGNIPMQKTLLKTGFISCCEIIINSEAEPTKERLGFEQVLF